MGEPIDVLVRPVYVWRLRDERDSITQRLLEPENIDDRFEMLDRVDEMIRGMPVRRPPVADRLDVSRSLKATSGSMSARWPAPATRRWTRIPRAVKRYWPPASERAINAHPGRS